MTATPKDKRRYLIVLDLNYPDQDVIGEEVKNIEQSLIAEITATGSLGYGLTYDSYNPNEDGLLFECRRQFPRGPKIRATLHHHDP